MKEQKICSFTQKSYRLQLLKITETSVNGYYQIRENRRIKATFTTLDAAIRKFYALQGSKILQKEIFTETTEEKTCIKECMKSIEIYPCADGYRLFGKFDIPQDANMLKIANLIDIPKVAEDRYIYKKQ